MNELFNCGPLFIRGDYGKTYVEDNLYIDKNEKLWIRENYEYKQVSEDDEHVYRMVYGELIDKVINEEKILKSVYKQFGIEV